MLRIALLALALSFSSPAQVILRPLRSLSLAELGLLDGPSPIGTGLAAIHWDGRHLILGGDRRGGTDSEVLVVRVKDALTVAAVDPPLARCQVFPGGGCTGIDGDAQGLVIGWTTGPGDATTIVALDSKDRLRWQVSTSLSAGPILDRRTEPARVRAPVHGRATLKTWRREGGDELEMAEEELLRGAALPVAFIRDVLIDPATQDIWSRASNQLIVARGSGEEPASVLQDVFIATRPDAQRLTMVRQGSAALILWNDRHMMIPGQGFRTVLRATRARDLRPVALDWGPFLAPAGSARYDLSAAPDGRSLAIADLDEKIVHLFQVTLGPALQGG